MWIKVLAYNLLNWFRQALLPENIARTEVPTVRRLIINVPGNIVGNGRYRHLRLAPNRWLSEAIRFIKSQTQGVYRSQGLDQCTADLTGFAF